MVTCDKNPAPLNIQPIRPKLPVSISIFVYMRYTSGLWVETRLLQTETMYFPQTDPHSVEYYRNTNVPRNQDIPINGSVIRRELVWNEETHYSKQNTHIQHFGFQ